MVLANGAIVLLVREEKIGFRLAFYYNTQKWLVMPKRENTNVKLLLHIACFSNRNKQKSHRMWKRCYRFTFSLLS